MHQMVTGDAESYILTMRRQKKEAGSPNFTVSGKLVDVEGKPFLCHLADQDYVYCGKKLIDHLKHASRVLDLGGNVMANMHHLQIVLDCCDLYQHGLQQADIDHED